MYVGSTHKNMFRVYLDGNMYVHVGFRGLRQDIQPMIVPFLTSESSMLGVLESEATQSRQGFQDLNYPQRCVAELIIWVRPQHQRVEIPQQISIVPTAVRYNNSMHTSLTHRTVVAVFPQKCESHYHCSNEVRRADESSTHQVSNDHSPVYSAA